MKNLKQQFIEKSKKKLLEKWKRIEKTMTNHMSGRKIWDADTNGLDDEANYLFVDETLENFLDSELSECWDMAGEEWKQATQKAIKHGILPIPNRYGEYVHITDHNRVIREMETIINSLTSQKEEKENLISLKDMIDEK